MMVKLPLYLKAIIYLFCFPAILGACSAPKVEQGSYEQARASVHLVNVGGGNGSGVMVAPFLMLTAAHVVGDGKNITVGPKQYPAKLVHKDEKNDIALLHVAIVCPCAPFALPPKQDDTVLVVGFPVNHNIGIQIATEGRIQGLKENRLQLSAQAVGGNSGGGVFVMQGGEWRLAGILVEVAGWCMGFACYPVPHLSRAVDTQTMTDFFQKGSV
jgi:S1-C subfamily serine protease